MTRDAIVAFVSVLCAAVAAGRDAPAVGDGAFTPFVTRSVLDAGNSNP